MEGLAVVLITFMIIFAFILGNELQRNLKLKIELEEYKEKLETSEFMVKHYAAKANIAEANLKLNNLNKVSKDTIDAVRYAMIKSHPDNGGKKDDFVKFKSCYEQLTK